MEFLFERVGEKQAVQLFEPLTQDSRCFVLGRELLLHLKNH